MSVFSNFRSMGKSWSRLHTWRVSVRCASSRGWWGSSACCSPSNTLGIRTDTCTQILVSSEYDGLCESVKYAISDGFLAWKSCRTPPSHTRRVWCSDGFSNVWSGLTASDTLSRNYSKDIFWPPSYVPIKLIINFNVILTQCVRIFSLINGYISSWLVKYCFPSSFLSKYLRLAFENEKDSLSKSGSISLTSLIYKKYGSDS